MNQIISLFTNPESSTLLYTSILAAMFGLVSSWLTYRFVSRREMLDSHRITAEAERQNRVRAELQKWNNDVTTSVDELYNRLGSIIHHQGHVALDPAFTPRPNSMWSVTHDYYITSSLFLFGQYFAWIQMLIEDVNFEVFHNEQEKKDLFEAILNVSKSLGDFPLTHCVGKDAQLFRLQQRAIADLFIVQNGEQCRTLRYYEFVERKAETTYAHHLDPLRNLLVKVDPEGDCRWARLQHLYGTLGHLQLQCHKILGHGRILALMVDHPEI